MAVAGGHAFLGQRGEADAESSLQAVEIPPFRMMATEVTLAKFEAWCSESVLGTRCKAWLGAENWQGRHHPVVNVPWHLASDYCAAWGGRLPSESEWEFAARSEARRLYPWGDLWQEASANYCDLGCDHSLIPTTYVNDGHAHTAAVGSFPDGATPEGILDLSGNVAEWTLDCWTPSHRRRSSWLPTAGACSKRVVRGGAWRDPKSSQAAWRRAPAHATSRSVRIGFRCVRGLDPVLP